MYATNKKNLLEMFVDRTAGESTLHNRLTTQETDAGNVALVAYGWLKIAEYNESRTAVTVFTGHKSLRSRTVSGYLNEAAAVAKQRGRDVILSGESPTVDKPNTGARYIGNYIGDVGASDKSSVEATAVNNVIDSLAHLS